MQDRATARWQGLLSAACAMVMGLGLVGCGVPLGHREVVQLGIRHEGLAVKAVDKGSLAERAGVQAGDALVSLNGTELKSGEDIEPAKAPLKLGDAVEIAVRRKDGTDAKGSATAEASDMHISSNYVVYGYEKEKGKTKRRWVHLGLVSIGDCWGLGNSQDLSLKQIYGPQGGISVDVDILPEHAARILGTVTIYVLTGFKVMLLGGDFDIVSLKKPNLLLSTLFWQRGLWKDGAPCANINVSLLSYSSGPKAMFSQAFGGGHLTDCSVWPLLGGFTGTCNDPKGTYLYLTPFNSVGWGGDELRGVTLAGIFRWRPRSQHANCCLLPFYSYSACASWEIGSPPLLSLYQYYAGSGTHRILWIPFRKKAKK